ncbi:MAG: hypothetical protein BM485_16345 [Desulfobulbaceae bacterium DB1]|nr:MAG: hypothetical protein BM485_16345 [Desulfobulbaceae bacterium DB1]
MVEPTATYRHTEKGQQGFTLFEVMVAVLLLAMVSSMIYSILNVSIKFSEKGEKRIIRIEREQGLLGLLQRQITCGVYDSQTKMVAVAAEDTVLKVTTRAPLLYSQAGTVLAVYRYDPDSGSLYYLEKRDFYNSDYKEDYIPDYESMKILVEKCAPLAFVYEEDSSAVQVIYDGKEYEFTPWCQTELRAMGATPDDI